jgi:hypothetical protein
MPRITNIQHRRGTAATWTSANPVLSAGEPGYETDTGKNKIGDGTTAWNSLAYQPWSANPDIASTYVTVASKGANNGVATLDSSGKIPTTQLPNASNSIIASEAYTLALIIGG